MYNHYPTVNGKRPINYGNHGRLALKIALRVRHAALR